MLTLKNIAGVAVGSGWQAYVAYINLGCYYLVGVPLGIMMEWVFHQGVKVTQISRIPEIDSEIVRLLFLYILYGYCREYGLG